MSYLECRLTYHRSRYCLALNCILVFLSAILFEAGVAAAEGRITDQVAVTVVGRHIFAVTSGEGLIRADLSAGEEALTIDARGLNALVLTPERLLGFSGQLLRWSSQSIDIREHVTERLITPQLILVRSDSRLYGFQGQVGHWRVLELDPQEDQRQTLVGENVAVVITGRRAIAFSALTGGFFSQDLQIGEVITDTMVNDNIVILTTSSRRLIFRSQLAIWAELR